MMLSGRRDLGRHLASRLLCSDVFWPSQEVAHHPWTILGHPIHSPACISVPTLTPGKRETRHRVRRCSHGALVLSEAGRLMSMAVGVPVVALGPGGSTGQVDPRARTTTASPERGSFGTPQTGDVSLGIQEGSSSGSLVDVEHDVSPLPSSKFRKPESQREAQCPGSGNTPLFRRVSMFTSRHGVASDDPAAGAPCRPEMFVYQPWIVGP